MTTTERATKLEGLAREVLLQRTKVTALTESINSSRALWELANAEFLGDHKAAHANLAQAEADLRTAALEVYEETGEKHPGPGVDIRLVEKVEYQPGDAFKWAVEHQIALSLNKKAFESLVKTGQVPIEVALLYKEATATIAQDLEKALKKEEE